MSREIIEGNWHILLTLVGLIVWFVRLEGKTLNNDRRLTHAEHQMETMESGIVKEMSEVKQALARIEGYMKAKNENEQNKRG